MSQEDVIKLWVALYPCFHDSCRILRFPEQGLFVTFEAKTMNGCDLKY